MAKAKKLPSGSWRVQASVTIDGQKIRRSFSGPTAAKAEKDAREWQEHIKMIGADSTRLTVKEAILLYCDTNKARLSPSTHAGYIKITKTGMPDIIDKPLYTLTCPIIQKSISLSLATLSAKTIKNRYGLLQTVLSIYHPEFIWAVKYPKAKKPVKKAYSDDYIKSVFQALKGTNFELEAYLGMLSMRASEVAGAKWEDVDFKNKTLHVCRTKLKDSQNKYVIVDGTKTEKSDRIIYLPDYVCTLLLQRKALSDGEYISQTNPSGYYNILNRILAKHGIEKSGFHQLRHIYSTVTSKLGIDVQVRMENGGWSNEHIMNGNYRHAMSEAQTDANNKMNDYVNAVSGYEKVHTKVHTQNRKRLKLVRLSHLR